MSGHTLVNQRGEPIAMVLTDKVSYFEVLGPPLPPDQWGAALDVGPDGKALPAGDFPVRHPNSGKTGRQPARPVSVTPIDNGTLGRVYTVRMPPTATKDESDPPLASSASPSIEVLKGYAEGLVIPIVETAKLAADGLGNIVTQPLETTKALAWGAGELGSMITDGWQQIVSDPGEALSAFRQAATRTFEKAGDTLAGDPREAGRLVGEVVGTVLPIGAAAKASKAKPSPAPNSAPNSGAAVLKKKPPPDGYRTYRTHGIAGDPRRTPEGRRLINKLKEQGYSERDAVTKARELLETGSTPPLANPTEIGDRLYKVVPEGSMPGPKSEYWANHEQIQSLEGLSRDQIADRLGLPLESQLTAHFDIVEIKAIHPTTTFVSKIAPTTQNGWSQAGGGLQTLITDRTAFTPPVRTGIKLP